MRREDASLSRYFEGQEEKRESEYRSAFSKSVGRYGVFQTISSGPDEFSSEAIELAEVLIVHAAEAINRIRNIFEMTRPTLTTLSREHSAGMD